MSLFACLEFFINILICEYNEYICAYMKAYVNVREMIVRYLNFDDIYQSLVDFTAWNI